MEFAASKQKPKALTRTLASLPKPQATSTTCKVVIPITSSTEFLPCGDGVCCRQTKAEGFDSNPGVRYPSHRRHQQLAKLLFPSPAPKNFFLVVMVFAAGKQKPKALTRTPGFVTQATGDINNLQSCYAKLFEGFACFACSRKPPLPNLINYSCNLKKEADK